MHARRCSLACHHLSEHPVAPEHSRSVCGKAQKASGKCRQKTSATNSDRPTSCKQPPATLPSFHCIKVICPSMPQVLPTAMDRDQMKNLITFHSFLPPPSMLALGLVSSISIGWVNQPEIAFPTFPTAQCHISFPSLFDAQLQQQNSPKCLRIVAIVKSSCQFMHEYSSQNGLLNDAREDCTSHQRQTNFAQLWRSTRLLAGNSDAKTQEW